VWFLFSVSFYRFSPIFFFSIGADLSVKHCVHLIEKKEDPSYALARAWHICSSGLSPTTEETFESLGYFAR
jgi:hypothetical protein